MLIAELAQLKVEYDVIFEAGAVPADRIVRSIKRAITFLCTYGSGPFPYIVN